MSSRPAAGAGVAGNQELLRVLSARGQARRHRTTEKQGLWVLLGTGVGTPPSTRAWEDAGPTGSCSLLCSVDPEARGPSPAY